MEEYNEEVDYDLMISSKDFFNEIKNIELFEQIEQIESNRKKEVFLLRKVLFLVKLLEEAILFVYDKNEERKLDFVIEIKERIKFLYFKKTFSIFFSNLNINELCFSLKEIFLNLSLNKYQILEEVCSVLKENLF